MHDGMLYGRIQGQGQGHEPLLVTPKVIVTPKKVPTSAEGIAQQANKTMRM